MRALLVCVVLLGCGALPAPPEACGAVTAIGEHQVTGEGRTLSEARQDAHLRLPRGASVVRYQEAEHFGRWYYTIWYTL